mmetsp:Transcript_33242/g.49541  ORF Transcript_33242/g.49541 Transcript_33242/m.49541 type:complete len:207 (-) Transcript_33242:270-890(-)
MKLFDRRRRSRRQQGSVEYQPNAKKGNKFSSILTAVTGSLTCGEDAQYESHQKQVAFAPSQCTNSEKRQTPIRSRGPAKRRQSVECLLESLHDELGLSLLLTGEEDEPIFFDEDHSEAASSIPDYESENEDLDNNCIPRTVHTCQMDEYDLSKPTRRVERRMAAAAPAQIYTEVTIEPVIQTGEWPCRRNGFVISDFSVRTVTSIK